MYFVFFVYFVVSESAETEAGYKRPPRFHRLLSAKCKRATVQSLRCFSQKTKAKVVVAVAREVPVAERRTAVLRKGEP